MPLYPIGFGGSGGGASLTVPDEQIFTSISERNTYFASNPDKLIENSYCTINGVLQQYRNGTWVDMTTLIQGSQGLPGVNGEDGKSSYEVAIQNGFVGTQSEWLASLKGDTGAGVPDGGTIGQVLTKKSNANQDTEWVTQTGESSGIAEAPEDNKLYGRKNSSWEAVTGTGTGVDGKSAYEIAVDNGFTGTEAEWLESLEGVDGIDGADGVSPTITEDPTNNDTTYKLVITDATNTITTPNLKGSDGISGEVKHSDLADRDVADQHPITAIIGLSDIATKADVSQYVYTASYNGGAANSYTIINIPADFNPILTPVIRVDFSLFNHNAGAKLIINGIEYIMYYLGMPITARTITTREICVVSISGSIANISSIDMPIEMYLPQEGTVGQVIAKKGVLNYEVEWVDQGTGGIPDATSDGKLYGRKDATWQEFTSTGGTSTLYEQSFVDADFIDNKLTITATAHGLGTKINVLYVERENEGVYENVVYTYSVNATGDIGFYVDTPFSGRVGLSQAGTLVVGGGVNMWVTGNTLNISTM